MVLVLDNTVMSNFALVGRSDLLEKLARGVLVTADAAWRELQAGIQLERVPDVDWSWLSVLTLSSPELTLCAGLMPPLDEGEAACLALAHSRGFSLLTDDRVARRLGVPLSGTIGVLTALIEDAVLSAAEANLILRQMIAIGYRSPVQML